MAGALPLETAHPVAGQPGLSIPRVALGGAALALLWFILCRHLSAEWTYNEQYSYGWFVPFLALFLFWLRWERRPAPEVGNGHRTLIALAIGIPSLLLLFPVRLFEIANPGWRPLDWVHTGIVATLTLLAIWMAGGKAWLKHFAFPVAFVFVALPWFTPIEEPIVQGLMRAVAMIVSEILNLLGVPAQFEGSVIRVNAGLVGVNEACSGVRSLQTSLMIGLLFGELYRFTFVRRVLLIVAIIALAFAANVMRAFFLVWMAATRGLDAMERGHDFAGYAILLIVFAGAVGIAALLKRGQAEGEVESSKSKVEGRGQKTEDRGRESATHWSPVTGHSPSLPNFYFLIFLLAWVLIVEGASEYWYRLQERNLIEQMQWTVRWPESSPGFRDIRLDEHTRRMLRFDEGRGVVWREKPTSESSPAPGTSLLYFFRWRPRHNSALLASLHRPDVCLPATGWRQTADRGVRYYPVAPGLSVPFRHFEFLYRLSDGREQFAHAFYCLWEDRVRPLGDHTSEDEEIGRGPSEWSRTERVRLVLEGRRHLGQQVMEFVMTTPEEISSSAAESQFAETVKQLIVPPAGSRK